MLNPERESTRVDLFVAEPFVFADEYRAAKWHEWGALRAPVLCLETLITMKEAAGRPQDLADAALLRDILQIERGKGKP